MKRDQYLYRKNRRTKKSNVLLCNSLKVIGDKIIYYRGTKEPGSDGYKCGRNKYEVNSNYYDFKKVGISCKRKYNIYELSEKIKRIEDYIQSIKDTEIPISTE